MEESSGNFTVEKWQRTVGATTYFIFNVFHQLRAIEDSALSERMLSVDELVSTIANDLPDEESSSAALVDFARINLAQFYDGQARAARREYVAPPNVAFADIASAFVDSPLGDHLNQVSQRVQSAIEPLRESVGGLQSHQGPLFRIQALTQPTSDLLRAGILAVAVGKFEQHLLQLKSIDEDRESGIPAGESRISQLLTEMVSCYAPALDYAGRHLPEVKHIIEERNAFIHREGRVDTRFVDALPALQIDDDSRGLLLDTSIQAMKHRVVGLLGFGLRASICSLLSQNALGAAGFSLEGHTALLEYLAPGLSQIHLDDLEIAPI